MTTLEMIGTVGLYVLGAGFCIWVVLVMLWLVLSAWVALRSKAEAYMKGEVDLWTYRHHKAKIQAAIKSLRKEGKL